MAWEVPGESIVRFKDSSLVSKVYAGLLTVTLLRTEGLPKVVDVRVWCLSAFAACVLLYVQRVKARSQHTNTQLFCFLQSAQYTF